MEVLIAGSVEVRAKVIRRTADGGWASGPILLGAEDEIALESLDFRCPLRSVYPK